MNYYNENDRMVASWLAELVNMGEIPDGIIDTRSIVDVRPEDLRDFTQCHFFAGIGGWPLALKLAGWPSTRPVWTGSPPCQPFSQAGQQQGVDDKRHLAPHFLDLVEAVRPPVVFGEQVAAAVRKDTWLDDLLDALEAEGYATGAAVLPACGVGAPHLRQRIWFVGRLGHAEQLNAGWDSGTVAEAQGGAFMRTECDDFGSPSAVGGMANGTPDGRRQERANTGRRGQGDGAQGRAAGLDSSGDVGGLANTESQRKNKVESIHRRTNRASSDGMPTRGPTGPTHGGWETVDWLFCRDGKWKPTQPGIFPLAHGLPKGVVPSGDSGAQDVDSTQEARVMRLRGYGNAIVPALAAEVIKTLMDE